MITKKNSRVLTINPRLLVEAVAVAVAVVTVMVTVVVAVVTVMVTVKVVVVVVAVVTVMVTVKVVVVVVVVVEVAVVKIVALVKTVALVKIVEMENVVAVAVVANVMTSPIVVVVPAVDVHVLLVFLLKEALLSTELRLVATVIASEARLVKKPTPWTGETALAVVIEVIAKVVKAEVPGEAANLPGKMVKKMMTPRTPSLSRKRRKKCVANLNLPLRRRKRSDSLSTITSRRSKPTQRVFSRTLKEETTRRSQRKSVTEDRQKNTS